MCRSKGKRRYWGVLSTRRTRSTQNIYRSKLPDVFGRFASRLGMVIVKMTPTFMITFVRNPVRRYLEHLDLESKIAYVFEEL